ncbi:MAG TPA: transglutaminase family protein [Tepidisphaeraceae bacterium]|jgi:transglutaminase-like putative cysteine protease
MLLKITHTTDLSYADLISESVMELRMCPRQEEDQHRLTFNLAIGPQTQPSSYFDWLGNTVHAFSITSFHEQIQIVATSVVETHRPRVDPRQLPDTFPVKITPELYWMYDYANFSGPVVDSPLLNRLAQQLNAREGEPLAQVADRMIDLIDTKFMYEQGVTSAASPITEILSHGRGVCQDFTHLMIGLARALKIPARYVSGYLHPEAHRYRGYTQTHAWCELYFPSAGWIGFDATNKCTTGDHFVKVAYGRDFRDVPPNKGIYRGSAHENIKVAVRSEELKAIPPELAADRNQSINIPTYPGHHQPHQDQVSLQQEQQQQ